MPYCRIILNALLLLLVTPGLAIHNQAEFHTSVESFEEELDAYAQMKQGLSITYDGFLKLIHDIENDELEKKYDLDDLDQINHFLISCARKGLLPSDDAEQLEADIEELLSPDDFPEFVFWTGSRYYIAPTALLGSFQPKLCKNVLKRGCKKTKRWIKKNKKPLIIVAAVGAAAAVTLGIAAAMAGSAAAGAASALKNSSESKDKKKETKPIPFPSNSASDEPPLIGSLLENELLSFKELVDREEFLNSNRNGFSLEENGRVLRDSFAYQTLDAFGRQGASNPQLHKELQELGRTSPSRSSEKSFSLDDFTRSLPKPGKGFDGNVYHLIDGNLYRVRGEHALELHSYDQAILDFSKVIEENPNHPDAYLDRATAHLCKGNYKEALEDHKVHLSQKPAPTQQLIDFTCALAKGLVDGSTESGFGLVSFAGDVLIHPIDTAREMWEGCSALAALAFDYEWAAIGKVLSPELHELGSKWNELSIDKRGELAAHAVRKIGTDLAAPAASAKVLSAGFKGAKQLAAACKALKNAEKTLALEALTQGLSKVATTSEAIQSKIVMYAKELGFTSREIIQLENIGKLEGSINDIAKNLPVTSQDINFATHALQRAVERGVSREAILDALSSPLKITEVKIDHLGRPSQRFIGNKAEVAINPNTQQVVSVNPISAKKVNKLNRELLDVTN